MENQNGFSTICTKCGRIIYEGEMLNIKGRYVCESCADSYIFSKSRDAERPKRRVPSAFFHLMFSFLPGAGHMYLGLMKKGLFQMCLFYLSIYLTSVFNGLFAFVIPIIWTYSFFDSLSLRRKIVNGEFIADDISGVTSFLDRHKGLVILAVLALIVCVGFNSLIHIIPYGGRTVTQFADGNVAVAIESAAPHMYRHKNMLDFIKPLALIGIGGLIVLKVSGKKKKDIIIADHYDND